jgi:DNA-binding IclR family transcriptional regulator
MACPIRPRNEDVTKHDAVGSLEANTGNETVSIGHRILTTLEACATGRGSLTLTELVEETGLAKSTLHRTCWKLVELGMLEHSEAGFSTGVKLFALGNANPVLSRVRAAAMPALLELQRVTGAMSNLAILHEGKALVVDALYSTQPSLPRLIGASLPLHCTAVGKAIAASLEADALEDLVLDRKLPPATGRTIVRRAILRDHLEQIAYDGLATSDEEFMAGVCGVASSVKLGDGTIVAIGFVGKIALGVIRQVSTPVRQSAQALEAALDWARTPLAVPTGGTATW